jgi:hypothetical protein
MVSFYILNELIHLLGHTCEIQDCTFPFNGTVEGEYHELLVG